MAEKDDRFPPIPALTDQPFMRKLGGDYEEVRADQIQSTTADLLKTMNELPDFDSVPADAKEYLARRTATHVVRLYEAGIQAGIDDERAANEVQAREDRSFRRNAIQVTAGG